MSSDQVTVPRGLIDGYEARIDKLERELAKSNHELSKLRTLHRQLVNGLLGLEKKLIEDTCG